MALSEKWLQHIEVWQQNGLPQATYCQQQAINVRTFSARLCEYPKTQAAEPHALIPVRIAPAISKAIVLRHTKVHLSAIVQQVLGEFPYTGSAFVFRNRAGNRLKVLLWDSNGVWLCQRRLHRGGFVWPKVSFPSFAVNASSCDLDFRTAADRDVLSLN